MICGFFVLDSDLHLSGSPDANYFDHRMMIC